MKTKTIEASKTKALGRSKKSYDAEGNLVTDTRGLSTVEYLILLVVIGVAGITVWKEVAGTVNSKASTANGTLGGM